MRDFSFKLRWTGLGGCDGDNPGGPSGVRAQESRKGRCDGPGCRQGWAFRPERRDLETCARTPSIDSQTP
ncbi:hypothetical protein FJTKL_13387 [Diaporthe vaccinii]|uniref:Uncharacterized protein n=1 Tax=Diaporthe vaccinii TaxID=105482 RepID=A0ABR4EAQ1_9PEZI